MFANLYRHAENPLFKCRSTTGGKEIAVPARDCSKPTSKAVGELSPYEE
jgi:hypothetical protein